MDANHMPACIPLWCHEMLAITIHLADCSIKSSMRSISSMDCSIKVACINDLCICHTDTVYLTASVNTMSAATLETNFIDVHSSAYNCINIYISNYMHNAALVGLILVTYTNIYYFK